MPDFAAPRCPHCTSELVDKGHGPGGNLTCRGCLADMPRGSFHAPAEPRQISYPGGKDGWYRVDCLRDGCEYEATEALPHKAIKRVQGHAYGKKLRP